MISKVPVFQKDLVKKDAPLLADANKIISELSSCLMDAVPPTDSQKVDQPIPMDATPMDKTKDEYILKEMETDGDTSQATQKNENSKEAEKNP